MTVLGLILCAVVGFCIGWYLRGRLERGTPRVFNGHPYREEDPK